MIPDAENTQESKVSSQISLHGMRMLIPVDTLRSVHNVGFIVELLICIVRHSLPTFFTNSDSYPYI